MKTNNVIYEKIGIEPIIVQFNLNPTEPQKKQYYITPKLLEYGFILEEIVTDYIGPVNNQTYYEHSFFMHFSNGNICNTFLLAARDTYSFIESFRIVKDIFSILKDYSEDNVLKILFEINEDVINYEKKGIYNTPEKFKKRLHCIRKRTCNEFSVDANSEDEIW